MERERERWRESCMQRDGERAVYREMERCTWEEMGVVCDIIYVRGGATWKGNTKWTN